MYNTSLRIVKDPMQAEDIMQDSFLAAFQKLNKYKGESTFGAWLKSIVVNMSIDYFQKAKGLPDLSAHLEDHGQVPEAEEEDNWEGINHTVNQINKAIDGLPSGYRVIISLYLIEGYDHEEIAGILKISSATSRSQYNRGKKKLKQVLIATS